MRSETRPRTYAVILIFTYAGAAASALVAVVLLLQDFSGHGGPAGNVLRVGFAIFSCFVGLFLLTVGILYRASFDNVGSDELH